MTRVSANYVVDKLLAKDQNVLILDTCCLLDIIRCIQRDNISVLESAVSMIEHYNAGSNRFEIILPSLIVDEWNDNVETVKRETGKFIENCDSEQKRLTKVANIFFKTHHRGFRAKGFDLDVKLSNLSSKFLDMGLCLEDIKECNLRAVNRVRLSTPPAKKAKDSLKDCIIFEETLWISRSLREKGFQRKIVFSTSNITEYWEAKAVIPNIQNELDEYGIEICKSLNHAYSLVKQ